MTAVVIPLRRPRSKAVRAGDVALMPRITDTSSGQSRSLWMRIPDGPERLAWLSSAGNAGSIHFARCSAAAERPATTARLPDHSHAATALSAGVSTVPRSAYTLRWIGSYCVRNW